MCQKGWPYLSLCLEPRSNLQHTLFGVIFGDLKSFSIASSRSKIKVQNRLAYGCGPMRQG